MFRLGLRRLGFPLARPLSRRSFPPSGVCLSSAAGEATLSGPVELACVDHPFGWRGLVRLGRFWPVARPYPRQAGRLLRLPFRASLRDLFSWSGCQTNKKGHSVVAFCVSLSGGIVRPPLVRSPLIQCHGREGGIASLGIAAHKTSAPIGRGSQR